MLVGYARTSTAEQVAGLETQITELNKLGCERIYQEQVSSVAERAKLIECISYIRAGDVLIVTKLDRLARSVSNLLKLVEEIEGKGCELRVLDMNLDTSKPHGKLMLSIFGAVAQFEREVMLERQREGIAKAKSEGKYKGRQPTVIKKIDEVEELVLQGFKPAEIMAKLAIGKTSFYKIKNMLQEKTLLTELKHKEKSKKLYEGLSDK